MFESVTRVAWALAAVAGVGLAWAAASDFLLGLVWWLLIPFIPAILILLLRGWSGLREFGEGLLKPGAEPGLRLPGRPRAVPQKSPSPSTATLAAGLSAPALTYSRERDPTRPLTPKTKSPTLQLPPRRPDAPAKLTDTGIFLSKNPTATPERWGRGELSLDGRNPVTFSLGGLERVDLGQRLSIAALQGLVVVLTKGGLRIVRLPEGLEVASARPLKVGDTIPFGSTLKLGGQAVGELSVVGLEGVPVPTAILDYTGPRPLQHRASLALFAETELGRPLGDPALGRLRLAPAKSGVRIAHIPGNLSVGLASRPNLEAGAVIPHGESLYLRDVSTRAGLGIIDVYEP
ncbi:MAG: hypothetical protein SFU83_14660 [Meiothermus sp.]|nr:hypothetical protein [Meiothermus sp.]